MLLDPASVSDINVLLLVGDISTLLDHVLDLNMLVDHVLDLNMLLDPAASISDVNILLSVS